MTLERGDFAAFFAAVRDGQRPFAWQERLLDHLLENGRWPDRLVAPTGAGKTAVVDAHVFANALSGAGLAPRVPRRLALVVDRRVVVDSHDEHARRVADALAKGRKGVLAAVAAGLLALVVDTPDARAEPLLTARLRGGSPAPRAWLDAVDRCAVISCTPDMWGSRLLFRGYGSSAAARPRAAGLLAMDAAVVVDEAHLSRQLLATARRVGALQSAAPEKLDVPVLQVVETTATPDPGRELTEVGVEPADLGPEDHLTARMTRPKPVSLLPLSVWPVPPKGADRAGAVEQLADAAVRLLESTGPTVGCVLNTVALAIDVAEELRRRNRSVELIVGRLRPADLDDIRRRRPGLLSVEGNSKTEFLVATQTVEVGIDLDLAAMLTEIAPGSALAQRSGRVNRRGLRPAGPVVVVGPAAELDEAVKPWPYRAADINAARGWIDGVSARPSGLAPWALRGEWAPPASATRRFAWSRLESADSWLLARTSDDLFAEPDLDFWIADDLDADTDVGLIARALPEDDAEALQLLRLTPPERHEVYPVQIGAACELLLSLVPTVGLRALTVRGDGAPAVLRHEQGTRLTAEALRAGISGALRPGDLIVLAPEHVRVRQGVPTAGGPATSSDVFEIGRPSPSRSATLRVGASSALGPRSPKLSIEAHGRIGAILETVSGPDFMTDRRESRSMLRDALVALTGGIPEELAAAVEDAGRLLGGRIADADIVLGGDGDARWLVIVDGRRARADDDLRQTYRLRDVDPSLGGHQAAVAARARRLAEVLGLGRQVAELLEASGAHHDDGKADARFQRMLGAEADFDAPVEVGALLAKSGRRTVLQERRARELSNLPGRWRHEQLSAAITWDIASDGDQEFRELLTRMVGTTHGQGRPTFPHGPRTLLGVQTGPTGTAPAACAAEELFGAGRWDELIEATDRRFGVWGTAYLEAVLRAADGVVSAGSGNLKSDEGETR